MFELPPVQSTVQYLGCNAAFPESSLANPAATWAQLLPSNLAKSVCQPSLTDCRLPAAAGLVVVMQNSLWRPVQWLSY